MVGDRSTVLAVKAEEPCGAPPRPGHLQLRLCGPRKPNPHRGCGGRADPATGFLHQNLSDRPALILDLLEPLRPATDAMFLRLLTSETFHPADFTIGRDGTCRLHPALARRVVKEVQTVSGVGAALSGLMGQIGHRIPVARQHRSIAWLAQRQVVLARH